MPRILIVEDNELNRDMLSRRLARVGHEVTAAENGQLGVEAARSICPDLILMDMGLPVMDGWEASRILKSTPDTHAIPIIGLSAHAMEGDRQRAMTAGCDDYDTKPLDFARLQQKIRRLLEPGPNR